MSRTDKAVQVTKPGAEDRNRIGIIGAGAIGSAFARALARVGIGAEGGRRVLFFSGDDAEAKSQVGALIGRLGFFGIDLGPLSTRARLAQPGGPLSALNLVKFD